MHLDTTMKICNSLGHCQVEPLWVAPAALLIAAIVVFLVIPFGLKGAVNFLLDYYHLSEFKLSTKAAYVLVSLLIIISFIF